MPEGNLKLQPIEVIGIGPGHPDFVTPAAHKRAALCGALVGGPRALALFDTEGKAVFRVTADLEGLKAFIAGQRQAGVRVGVLVSGDPGFYSLLPFLRRAFGGEALRVTPGIGSLQAAFAALAQPWQEAQWFSLHGRQESQWLEALAQGRTVGLLTGPGEAPEVARQVLAAGLGDGVRLWTLSDLSYEKETKIRWRAADLAQEAGKPGFANTVVVIEHENQ